MDVDNEESWGKAHFGDFEFRRGDIVCYGLPVNYLAECLKYQEAFQMKDVVEWGFTLLIAYLSNNSVSNVPYSQVVTHVGIIVKDGNFDECRVAEALNDGFIRHTMGESCGSTPRFISVRRRVGVELNEEEMTQAMHVFDQVAREYGVDVDEVDKAPGALTLPYSWWHILNFAIQAHSKNQTDEVLNIRDNYRWSIDQANTWLLYLTTREQSRGLYALVCSESVTQMMRDCQLHCRSKTKLWNYFAVTIDESRVLFPHEQSAGQSHCNVPFFHRPALYDMSDLNGEEEVDLPLCPLSPTQERPMLARIPVIGKQFHNNDDNQSTKDFQWLRESRLGKEINMLQSKREDEVGWFEEVLNSMPKIDLSNEKEVFLNVSMQVESFLLRSLAHANQKRVELTETLQDKLSDVGDMYDDKMIELRAKERVQKIMDVSNETRQRIAYNIKVTASTQFSVLSAAAKNRIDLLATFFHMRDDASFQGCEGLLQRMQSDDKFMDQTMGQVSHLLAHAPTPRPEQLQHKQQRGKRFGDQKPVRAVVDSKPVQWFKAKITNILNKDNSRNVQPHKMDAEEQLHTQLEQVSIKDSEEDSVDMQLGDDLDNLSEQEKSEGLALKMVFWLFKRVVEPYFRKSSAAIIRGERPVLEQVPVNFVRESNALVYEDPNSFSKPPLTFFSYVMPNDLLFATTHECVHASQKPQTHAE